MDRVAVSKRDRRCWRRDQFFSLHRAAAAINGGLPAPLHTTPSELGKALVEMTDDERRRFTEDMLRSLDS